MGFWNRVTNDQPSTEPPAKRISTPAGQRLSVILASGDGQKHSRGAHRASMRKSAISTTLGEVPRESNEQDSTKSSGYTYNVWSDGEKFGILTNNNKITKRLGWKKLLVIIALIIAGIIALAVGLAVGLKKKHSNDTSSNPQAPNAAEATNIGDPSNPSANPTRTNSHTLPTSTPSNFPLGSYSLITFLDTVQANCTANPSTWTCYPYTIYNSDRVKAVATFNWIITSPSNGEYRISSTENPFSISFKNTKLELLDQGKDTERYRFQISQTKTVKTEESLTEDDDATAECEFENTSLTAYLYTKMPRTYSDTNIGESTGEPEFPVWPFAVRVEQTVGGGENVPSCRVLQNGKLGKTITEGLKAQDVGGLCSCLYKNWRTPSPYEM